MDVWDKRRALKHQFVDPVAKEISVSRKLKLSAPVSELNSSSEFSSLHFSTEFSLGQNLQKGRLCNTDKSITNTSFF